MNREIPNSLKPNMLTNEGVVSYVLGECQKRNRKLNAQVSSILQANSSYLSPANKAEKRSYPLLNFTKDENSRVLYYLKNDVVEWTEKLIQCKKETAYRRKPF